MKCSKCVAEGKTSRVYTGGGSSTCMAWDTYYDEDGKYHSHDPNYHSSNYRCSNGHEWVMTYIAKCSSCDYGKDDEKTEILRG